MQIIKDSIKTIIVSLIVISLATAAYAWTEPSSPPPAGNAFAPINTGSDLQYKSGSFGVTTPGGNAQTLLQQWGLYSPGTMYIEPGKGSNLYLTDQWNQTGMLNVQFGKTIFESGNVGIGMSGTSTPESRLHIVGTPEVDAWDNQYTGGYRAGGYGGRRMIGGAHGWVPSKLYINGFGDWTGGVQVGSPEGGYSSDLLVNGNVGIGTAEPRAKLDVRGFSEFTGNVQIFGNISAYNVGRSTYTVLKANRGTTTSINFFDVSKYCSDDDGCELRLVMSNWDGTRRKASRRALFFLDYYNNNWRSEWGDWEGTVNNGTTQHIMNAWACYFTDGKYSNWVDQGDSNMNFGLLSWSEFDADCTLTIID